MRPAASPVILSAAKDPLFPVFYATGVGRDGFFGFASE